MRHIDSIYIHCTATQPDFWEGRRSSEKAAECKRWHIQRGWSDVGYTYFVDRDGTVTEGRPIEKTPAAQKGHNTGSVAISLGVVTAEIRVTASQIISRQSKTERCVGSSQRFAKSIRRSSGCEAITR